MNPVAKYLAFTAAVVAIMLGCAYAGWQQRGFRCEAEIAAYKLEQAEREQAQFEAGMAVEAKNNAATDQSTQRLDVQQAKQQKEIVYVDKQVIQYRDRWRDRACRLPDDWLHAYNRSLFGDDPAMPEAGKTGSAPDSTTMLLPTGRN